MVDRDWKPAGPLLEGHDGRVVSLAFSDDGHTLASASEDGTVLLRDIATQKQIGSPLTVDAAGALVAAAFTPRDDRAVRRLKPGPAVRWDVAPEVVEATGMSHRRP